MTSPLQLPRRAEAFTLLEILIAVSIFAVVLAAINTVFYGAMRLRNQTVRNIERTVPIQIALETIKRDLSEIVPPGGALGGNLKSGSSGSVLSSIASISAQAGPEFYTSTAVITDNQPWSQVQKVTYFLRPPTNQVAGDGQDLIRGVTRNLLSVSQEEREDQWLMGDVSHLAFLFYDGTEWREDWDSTNETTALPKAIKVQIELAKEEPQGSESRLTLLDRKPVLEVVAPIIIQVRTNQTN